MPTNRIPLNVAQITGAAAKNPKRFKNRGETPKDDRKIGRCPQGLNPEERKAWGEIVQGDPGVLALADRGSVELAARLMAEVRVNPEIPASKIALLANILNKLGRTPQGRNNLELPKEPEKENPFARFNRPRTSTPEQREARKVPGVNILD